VSQSFFFILADKNEFMLIDEVFEVIYLNYKIKNIAPFLKKLIPKDKKVDVALLKKQNNKKLSQNRTAVLASLICCKAGNEYRNKSGYNMIPAYFVDELIENYLSEKAPFLNNLFNSYQGVDYNGLIIILYWIVYFSDFLFTRKNNEFLSCSVNQYDTESKVTFSDVLMKLRLASRQSHYLFLYPGLFNNFETRSGMAFEALLSKIVLDHLKVKEQVTIIGKKISLKWLVIKRFTGLFSKLINLIANCNAILEKLLIPILSAVEKSVFRGKKLIEPSYKLLKQNRPEPAQTVIGLLEEWKKK
ncbi:hypothetical protein DBR28_12525, partial [Chryseobacterium sp. HMWF028]